MASGGRCGGGKGVAQGLLRMYMEIVIPENLEQEARHAVMSDMEAWTKAFEGRE